MTSDRHAYLIIAHNKWKQLQKLISLIDDKRNDIYIHIDKKSDTSDLHLSTTFSNITFFERNDVRWGDVSQVNTEITLFQTALMGGGLCVLSSAKWNRSPSA